MVDIRSSLSVVPPAATEPGVGRASGTLSHSATPSTATPKSKFAVYDLVENKAPKNFFEAAEAGDSDMIIRMIERTLDFDVNQKDRLGRTALHWAVEAGQHDAASVLIDFGINIKGTDCVGRVPVHLAARSGDVDMLKLLLREQSAAAKEELVNWPDQYHITPVYLALQRGEEGQTAFDYLMACGGHYNQNTPLMFSEDPHAMQTDEACCVLPPQEDPAQYPPR